MKVKDSQKVNLPDFIIAGFQKCGTTSLHNYLSSHPDVTMSLVKEPCFFVSDIKFSGQNTIVKDIGEYSRLFAGSEKLCGESTTHYSEYVDSFISNVENVYGKDDAKKIKIILLIRNPAERLFSAYKHFYVRDRGLKLEEFESFVDGLNKSDEIVERGKYYGKLKKILEYFDNVQILIFEDFFSNLDASFNRVCDFIGVARIDVENKKFNSSSDYRISRNLLRSLIYAKQKLKQLKAYLISKGDFRLANLGTKIFNCLSRILNNMLGGIKKDDTKGLTKQTKQKIINEFYLEDISLIDSDIIQTHWLMS